MEQYNITGMSCAACSARVEKAVSNVDGVSACSVSLLTNSMGIEGNAAPEKIIAAVEAAGYGAALKDSDILTDKETPAIKKRLIFSVVFLLPLMYFSMGHMLNLPLPSHRVCGILQMVLAIVIMAINRKFFISGFKGAVHKAPNMDTLVALGSGASFIYSVFVLFFMNDEHLYFESAAMILTLITVGKMLEAYSKGKTTNALKGLISLAPKTATVIRNGKEETIPASQVKKGDIFIVKPGEKIPVDGMILEGETAINEAALTGESIPVDKTAGSSVSAATVNTSGFIKCEATRVGEDTTLSQIIKMVSDAAATKAPISKTADRVSGIFVPAVIAIAAVTFAIWMLLGKDFGFALSRGISVLVISCPCALGLATPVAVMVGNGLGAKNGILFKTAASLEETGKIQILALDKTGTITKGEPKVTDIIPLEISKDELLSLAYSLEIKSEHPLAKAIVAKAEETGVPLPESEGFRALTGSGVSAVINGTQAFGGNLKLISQKTDISDEILQRASTLADEGKTPLFFATGGKLAGIVAVSDIIKEDSPLAVSELQNMGITVVMLTGDNIKTAKAIAKQAGIDSVFSDVLPDDKERIIKELQKSGKVAMAGDGINDAPALTRADIGIAVNTGSDIAIDAAEIVLMNDGLSDVPAAIRLSRATLKNIRENLFWAFIYNVIGIPLAAGLWIPITGWTLSPMFGAAAMSLSSFCVVLNALRLNLFKLHSSKYDKKIKPVQLEQAIIKEKKEMKKIIKIEGMMCPHCEAAVKSALEAINGVEEATASHEANEATVTLSKEIDNSVLKKAVEDKDYTVISID